MTQPVSGVSRTAVIRVIRPAVSVSPRPFRSTQKHRVDYPIRHRHGATARTRACGVSRRRQNESTGGRECHEAFRKGHGGVGRGRMHILFGGVATANAADVTNKDNPITSSNVRVSDVGAQTANVSFDYKIDPAQVDEIKDVCFSIEVQRITDITPIEKAHSSANTIGGTGFPYAARAFPMMS